MNNEPTDSPTIMQDFVFGALESDANTLAAERQRWSGVRHHHAIDPLDPQPEQPVTLTVTVGRDVLVERVTAYVTTDGSQPAGARGVATNGFAVDLQRVETRFQFIYWDYAELWQGQIPGLPEGTHVRYVIEGFHPHPQPLSQGERGVWPPSPSGRGVGGEGESIWSNELRIDGTAEAMTTYGYTVDRFQTPAWAHEAVVYQVLVDRFAPAPDRWLEPAEMETFIGGNLRGVIDNLDYIAGLNVDALWLTPIFRIGSYHGYDTIDYLEIEPRFGTKADLAELVQKAHARGLRVILDFVANHSSDQFPLFQQALADPASPAQQLYDFSPAYQHGYRCFFTAANMPQFNHDHPEARRYLLDAARYWLREFGVDGYRLDYAAGPSHDFWSAFGAACKETNPDCWIFGEVTLGSDSLRTYAGRLDGCLDFGFVRQVRLLCAAPAPLIPVSRFAAVVQRTQRYFPASFTRPAFIDNHDMNRFLWATGNDKHLLRMAAALLLGFGGTPILYYGTEVGLSQPRAKGHYREEARHPMLWGDGQDKALLAEFQRLIAFRRSHPALVYGEIETLALDDERGLWLARRAHGDDQVLIAVNGSLRNGRVALPAGSWVDLVDQTASNDLHLSARSVAFLISA
ncbi:MAG: alpha-amylase family glycosyl hydrolase [Anaerolineae bacterium]